MDPQEGMKGGTFSARLHCIQGTANAKATPNRYHHTNDLITKTNTAESICCYTETRACATGLRRSTTS